MTSTKREYKAFPPANVTRVPNLKHATGDDPTRTTREAIRRPSATAPKRADWR